MRSLMTGGVALAFLWLVSGCSAVLVGGGAGGGVAGYSYIKGQLIQEYAAPLETTWNASLAAVKDLELTVSTSQKDRLGGRIIARRADDTRIAIELEPRSAEVTTVKIRVGTFGDPEVSARINDAIKVRLGKP